MLHLITCVRTAKPELPAVYANDQEKLFVDITAAYIEAVKVFYDLGCRTLQLDDTSWGNFAQKKNVPCMPHKVWMWIQLPNAMCKC